SPPSSPPFLLIRRRVGLVGLPMAFLPEERFPELVGLIQGAVDKGAHPEKLQGGGEFFLLEELWPVMPLAFEGGEAVLGRDDEINGNDDPLWKMGKRRGDQLVDDRRGRQDDVPEVGDLVIVDKLFFELMVDDRIEKAG